MQGEVFKIKVVKPKNENGEWTVTTVIPFIGTADYHFDTFDEVAVFVCEKTLMPCLRNHFGNTFVVITDPS